MSIAFVPFYLRFIGAEGYGLVGFFVMLSASLSILDAGLAAVATREAAGYLGAKESRRLEIVTLLRTIEVVFLAISLIVGLLVSLASPLIVKYWLNVPTDMVAGATWAVSWMGLSIATQFLTSLYTGCLNGFQKQVGLNVINVVGSTVRGVGAILVLWLISPTVQTFFAWQAIGGAGMLVAQRILFVREMHATPVNFGFSLDSLKRVRHFMAGMGAINVLAFLLTQLDKIVLSKVLSLEAFGHYSLAWMLGTLIYRLIGPVFNSYYPRITQLLEQQNTPLMLKTYQQACQVMAIVVVPISLWLALYSYEIIELWTRNSAIASQAAGALSILAIGTMFNAFMHIPYAMQLAH
ncbi:MAG: MATE family efflux transporter, partial [Methylotenera sp.]|nr:MATE family efflux transporter [Methylotenera sp.]